MTVDGYLDELNRLRAASTGPVDAVDINPYDLRELTATLPQTLSYPPLTGMRCFGALITLDGDVQRGTLRITRS